MGKFFGGCLKGIIALVIAAVAALYFLGDSLEDDGKKEVKSEKMDDAKRNATSIARRVINEGLANMKEEVVEGVKEKVVEGVKEQVENLSSGGSSNGYERMLTDDQVSHLCLQRGFPQDNSTTTLREGSYEIKRYGAVIKAVFRKEHASDSRIIGKMKLMGDDEVLGDYYVAYGGGNLYTMYESLGDLGTENFDVFYAKPSSILIYSDGNGQMELERR